jgi:hypothetical protein
VVLACSIGLVAACSRSHRYSRADQDAEARDGEWAPDGSDGSQPQDGSDDADARSPGQGCAPAPGGGGSDPGSCTPVRCGTHLYECGDCVDNDGDGLIDSDDPGCIGPCDHSEVYFWGSILEFARPNCTVDCQFDANRGSGDDQCYMRAHCDARAEPVCEEDADRCEVEIGERCLELCGPVTPNGCDCFGCCELVPGSGQHVWLHPLSHRDGLFSSCNLEAADDPEACPPCTPTPECYKPCGECDLCLGKRELPASCDPCERCAEGRQPCGLPDEARCPEGEWCITGCCVASPYFNTSPL